MTDRELVTLSDGAKYRTFQLHRRADWPHVPMSPCVGCGKVIGPEEQFAMLNPPRDSRPTGWFSRCHPQMTCLDAAVAKGFAVIEPYDPPTTASSVGGDTP